MKVRECGENERERFNAFVAAAPKGHFLQSYEWGELKARTGWKPIRLVAEQDGEIRGALSMLQRRLPLPGKSILYAPRGPVLAAGETRALAALVEYTRGYARRSGAIFLKLDPDIPMQDTGFPAVLRQLGFVGGAGGKNFEGVQPKFVFRLDISADPDTIFASFAPKTRYNIRLASKKGVTVTADRGKDYLPVFYALLQETATRDRFLIRSYSYFNDIWDQFVERGMAKLFLAEYEGKVVAGTLAFIMGDKAWYLYGASGNQYRNVMPNYLLQWEMIRWAKENGCRMYDFRGVSGDLSEDNPLYGLYRFKKGFNGELVEFIGEYDLLFSPGLYWLWQHGEPLYRQTRHKLANAVKRMLGKGSQDKKQGEDNLGQD